MRAGSGILLGLTALLLVVANAEEAPTREPELRSIAIKTANTDKLVAFYSDAFGGKFRAVEQLGFAVADVHAVVAIAIKHGGRLEGDIQRQNERVRAAIRDPDGNTIEIYQDAALPKPKGKPWVGVYSPGPKWLPGKSFQEQPLREHGAYMAKLYKEGKLRDGGPFLDSEGGLAVFYAKDEAEAKALVAADPGIAKGIFTAKLHPWYPVEWGK